jgi:2-hydroxychromene-2-carboxylate isomerase
MLAADAALKSAGKNEDWRAWAEENRQLLVGKGCWGVPSFAYGNLAVWGQDRIWAIEDAILRKRGAGTRRQ